MAIRSGLAGQLGFAAETTWNTYAAPTRYLEFTGESLKNSIARIDSKALRASNFIQRTDRWAQGRQGVAGDLNFEVANKGFGLMIQHCLGAVSTSADGAGYKHEFTPADPYGLGLTVQVGRPGTDGTVQPFTYTGCKVTSFDFANSVDNFLTMKVSLDGAAEDTGQTLGSASYPASQELFTFEEGVITVAGSSYNITDWTISTTRGIKTDRYFVGSATKSQQIINAYMTPTISLTAELSDTALYALYTAGTLANIVLTYSTTSTYDTGKPYKIVFTLPNVRFDGATPNLNGMDIVTVPMNGVALYDGTNAALAVDYYTSDTTP